jgi:hypothetical protein
VRSPLQLRALEGGGLSLHDGETLLAQAVESDAALARLRLPPLPALEQAEAAGAIGRMRARTLSGNPYDHCFGCGIAREDGLRLVPVERDVPLAVGAVAQARSILEAQLSAEPAAPLGWVYTYAAGTTTPIDSYTTQSGASTHTNPAQLDAEGEVIRPSDTRFQANILVTFKLRPEQIEALPTFTPEPGIPYRVFA